MYFTVDCRSVRLWRARNEYRAEKAVLTMLRPFEYVSIERLLVMSDPNEEKSSIYNVTVKVTAQLEADL